MHHAVTDGKQVQFTGIGRQPFQYILQRLRMICDGQACLFHLVFLISVSNRGGKGRLATDLTQMSATDPR